MRRNNLGRFVANRRNFNNEAQDITDILYTLYKMLPIIIIGIIIFSYFNLSS